jgi:Flp pilus assembly protein protease CpaA
MIVTAGLTLGFCLLALDRKGPTLDWALRVPLLAGLAVVTVLDLRTRLIPDLLTLPALAYALVIAAIPQTSLGLVEAAKGALVGGGVVLLAAILTRGGLGGGDVKLMAMLGGALGWKAALVILALSQLVGGAIALGLLLMTRRADRKSPLPVGALIALLGGLWLGLRS